MRERGTAAYAIVVMFILIFIAIFMYTQLHTPITDTVDEFEEAAGEGSGDVPSGIWGGIDLMWALFPIILVMFAILYCVAHIYQREHEHAYR